MYLSKSYLSESRLHAYIEQYKYVNEGDKVLEIGNGGGVFKALAGKISNYSVIDIDASTEPDYVGDITKWDCVKQFQDKFDLIFCCQVLEHIPFLEAKAALANILKLNSKIVVVSIPDNRKAVRFKMVFRNANFERVYSIPFSGIDRNISNNKEHHWELWHKNKNDIMRMFDSNETHVLLNNYRLFERHYQHFFVLERK